jgi:membrane-bound serine protease (ClpP class)
MRHTHAILHTHQRFRRVGALSWLAAAGWLLAAAPVQAQKGQGEWIDVPSPITSEVVSRVRQQAESAAHPSRGVNVLVFRFRGGEPSDFGPCKDLADFLLDNNKERLLEGREIVAYVDKPVNGHAVLPILACQSIYMSTGATLGFDEHALKRVNLDKTTIQAYSTVANARPDRSVAIPLKMLHPDFRVLRIDDGGGRRLKLQTDQPAPPGLEPGDLVRPEELNLQPQVFSEAGQLGIFKARDLEKIGFVTRAIASQQELGTLLEVQLWSNPLATQGDPRAAVITVKDQIDRGTLDMLRRKVERAIRSDKVNCVILKLENVEGGPEVALQSYEFAQFLIKEAAEHNVLTIAFIPESAGGAAVFLTFACDQIIMGPEAKLDARSLVENAPNRPVDENERLPIQQQLMDLAGKKNYSPVLVRGMVDLNVEIVRASERPDANQPQRRRAKGVFFAKNEVPPQFELDNREPIKTAGSYLVIDAKRQGEGPRARCDALDWGVARSVLGTKDIKGVLALCGIPESNVKYMGADWLDRFVFILRHEVTTVFLVIIGFTCLILELKSPGLTFPGVTAALCFLLVFWAHSWLAGEVNTLAILLFLLGLVLIGVEVFLLPGFGITGISGIVMMLLGLTLLVVRQWPQSQGEYVALGTQFSLFAGSLIVSVLGAFMLGRYIRSVPFFNRMMLEPPDEANTDAAGSLSSVIPPTLLGAFGTAVTPLAPVGRAAFGEQYLDVTTEGTYVDAGSRVQVIEIEGLRVVVRAL